MRAILDFFRGSSDGPSRSQIEKAVKQVTQPHGDPSVRMSAADRLKAWGTEDAIAGLLRRFTLQTPSGVMDLEECQQVEAMLVDLGPRATAPILRFLGKEDAVAYPARVLKKVLSRDQYVAEVLRVLESLEAGFGSSNEQRAGLLHALDDIEDARIAPGARRFLSDPNDDVSVAAIGCVVRARDPQYRKDMVDLLVAAGDRPRVQREVAEQLALLGWGMEEERKTVEASLPAGFYLDKKGRVIER